MGFRSTYGGTPNSFIKKTGFADLFTSYPQRTAEPSIYTWPHVTLITPPTASITTNRDFGANSSHHFARTLVHNSSYELGVEMSINAYEKLNLTGKSIIVTGGASGMGAEASKLFAARGAKVTVSI